MRVAVLLLLLAGCAPERDYTLTVSDCPSEASLDRIGQLICDRGVGNSPRFVSFGDCEVEAGASRGSVMASGNSCSHPGARICPQYMRAPIFCTYDSIASAAR